jgi:hypothetical protein
MEIKEPEKSVVDPEKKSKAFLAYLSTKQKWSEVYRRLANS